MPSIERHKDVFKRVLEQTTRFSAPTLNEVGSDSVTHSHGVLQVQNVLTNLIHEGAIPPTIGVFITPGNVSEHYPDDLGWSNPGHDDSQGGSMRAAALRWLWRD